MNNIHTLPSIDILSSNDPSIFATKRSFVTYISDEGVNQNFSSRLYLRIPSLNPEFSDWYKQSTFLEVKGTMVDATLPGGTTFPKNIDFNIKAFIQSEFSLLNFTSVGEGWNFEELEESSTTNIPNTNLLIDGTAGSFPIYYNPYFKSYDFYGVFPIGHRIVVKGIYLLM